MERQVLKTTTNIATQTDRPYGAVIIQTVEKDKKKSTIKKKQINDVPNAIPSQEQKFRVFKEIDYPYLMRDVQIQNQEDKLIKSLREVFGIKEKTPEIVAEEALKKAEGKGRSNPLYPLYTDPIGEKKIQEITEMIKSDPLMEIEKKKNMLDELMEFEKKNNMIDELMDLRDVFNNYDLLQNVRGVMSMNDAIIQAYNDEEITEEQKRIIALNTDKRLQTIASIRGIFEDNDALLDKYNMQSSSSSSSKKSNDIEEEYMKYMKAFDSKYLEDSTPLSQIPYPKIDIENLEDRIASLGSYKPLDYSGRGRPSANSEKFKAGSSRSRKETLDIKLPKEDPIEKALEEYEFIQSNIEGRVLTQSELQKERERLASSILKRWGKIPLAKENLFNMMLNKSIQVEAFNYRLEQMRLERQRQDIERQFGVYDSTRRARRGGEINDMTSLLFDVD
jgi:hypothetical protein